MTTTLLNLVKNVFKVTKGTPIPQDAPKFHRRFSNSKNFRECSKTRKKPKNAWITPKSLEKSENLKSPKLRSQVEIALPPTDSRRTFAATGIFSTAGRDFAARPIFLSVGCCNSTSTWPTPWPILLKFLQRSDFKKKVF